MSDSRRPASIGLESGNNQRRKCNWMTSCCLPMLGFFNAIGLVGLGLIVAFLFFQVQYVTFKLKSEYSAIEELRQQVQNQTVDQIQELTEQVDHQKSYATYQVAGFFTLLTCLITMFHMASHLRNMYQPVVQRKILAILWMSPIYSCTSFFGLCVPVSDGYLSIIKDFYEAYVVYSFLSFLIAVLGRGDRGVAVEILARDADHLDTPTRCLRRFYHPQPEESDKAKANAVLTQCQLLAMQFVFVRPLTSIASFLVFTLSTDMDQDGQADTHQSTASSSAAYFLSPGFFIAMVENLSVFFAFTGLLKFYHAVADELAWLQPFNKFLAIKGIVFLTFWQGLAISIIVHLHGSKNDGDDNVVDDDGSNSSSTNKDHAQAMAIQNLLICVEMLFFSLAHWCVFPPEEWEPGYRPKKYAKPGLGIKDFASDVSVLMGRGQQAMPVPTTPPGIDAIEMMGDSDTYTITTGPGSLGPNSLVETYPTSPDSLGPNSLVDDGEII